MDVLSKPEVIRAITDALSKTGVFATVAQLDRAVADLQKKVFTRTAIGVGTSWSAIIRGLAAQRGQVINDQTRESDINYLQQTLKPVEQRALSTGSATGSYLVPTIQSSEIIAILTDAGVLRRIGPRVWPMANIDSLTIPVESATPTIEWLGQNTAQSATDPGLDQVHLTLKTARGLVALPNELLAVSVPSVDAVITELLGIGMAEKLDTSFFATSSQAGGFTSVYSASNTTTRLANGNNANGGAVTYNDLLQILNLAFTAKARPPFFWAMAPKVFFTSVLSILDLVSRPIVQEDSSSDGVNFTLFGYPVYLSALMPINQTNGSGSNQSYILFANPKYIHFGEGPLEIMFSMERYFEANQTAVRISQRCDTAYAPPAGICILKGCA